MYNEYNRYDDYNDHHIRDERMYRDAVRNLRWENGKGQGERWKKDDLIDRSNINFNEEYFTPYDYAYAVNMMYANYGKLSEKPDYYEEMTKSYLRNDSYPERGDERAYYDAARRSRRYNMRNVGTYEQYEYHPKSEPTYRRYEYDNRRYDYDNRRGYDRRADRDNDGRYNE